MSVNWKVALSAMVIATACSGERPARDATSARDSARVPAAPHDMSTMSSPSDTTGMAGMDHSAMTAGQPAGQGAAAMSGMDHSRMDMANTRPNASGRAAAAMPDHNMPMGNRSQSSARDPHAGMAMTPGLSAQPAPPEPHAGMNMAEPAEELLPDDVGMEKLRALIAELVRDPEVLARIQADPALRELWQDPGVRQYLLKRP